MKLRLQLIYSVLILLATHVNSDSQLNTDTGVNKLQKPTSLLSDQTTKLKGTHKRKKANTEEKAIKFSEATITIFFSGLGDKSFFITTIMALKHSKIIVYAAAVASLSIMGVISVFLGIGVNKFVPGYLVDMIAIVFFFIIGVKMLLEGIKMPDKTDLMLLEEEHVKLRGENAKSANSREEHVVVRDDTTYESMAVSLPNNETSNLAVFMNTFLLIFVSEIGDRSQISTIYISKSLSPMLVVIAVIGTVFFLSLLAVLCGHLISNKIPVKTITIIAGSLFIIFGLVALYACMSEDFHMFQYSAKQPSSSQSFGHSNLIIPKKEVLIQRLS